MFLYVWRMIAWLGRRDLSLETLKLDLNCVTQAPDVLVPVPRQVPRYHGHNEQGIYTV